MQCQPMKKMSRWPHRLAMVAVGGALATAALCFSAGISSVASASTAHEKHGKHESAKGLIGQIEKTHQLKIAMSAFAPEDFQKKTGRWTGYDITILKGFAATLHAHLVIDSIPFASSVEAVSTQRDDITIDIYYTATRAKVIDFSRPMLNYVDAIAVNKSNPQVTKASVGGLSGKDLGVVTGSENVGEAKKVPNATITAYTDIANAFLALSQGRVAATLQPDVDISWQIHKDPSENIKLLGPVPASIGPPIASLRGYYGVPKKPDARPFLQNLNQYLKKIECNGTEHKLLKKYGMGSPIYLKGICAAPNVYRERK